MKLPVAADHTGEPDPQRAAGERHAPAPANDRGEPHARQERKPHHRGQGPRREGADGKGQGRPGQKPVHGFGHKQHAAKPEGERHEAGRPDQGKPGKKRFRNKRRSGFGGGKPARAA